MAGYLFQVHMEAERKAIQLQGDAAAMAILPFHEKITYRVGNKVYYGSKLICAIGISHLTSYSGFVLSFLRKSCFILKDS